MVYGLGSIHNFVNMDVRLIEYDSAEYEAMIGLRVTALLEPIGVPASYIDSEREKDDFFIGAFEGSEIIGCCILTRKDNHTLQLRQMAVIPHLRGRKIGVEIIRFAESVAKQNHYNILMMHARDPVIGFYEKCGYSIVGDQFFEVGMGHHKMQKELTAHQVS